jgi:protein arginine N-methyltransferase 1
MPFLPQAMTAAPRAPRIRGSADYYYDSYSYLQIHEDMLKDRVRTCAYRDAIEGNPSIIAGKVVLDVGCGTGILSMFAARAGARKVYGVEASGIVEFARVIVEENGLSDRITIIQGTMEEVELPEKVDVVVSEWMGYALLYESMLPSVISARDRFMKKDGTMFPNWAHLYIAGIHHPTIRTSKIDYWNNVHGFDFAPIKRWAEEECLVEDVKEAYVVTEECMIAEIDLNTVTRADLAIRRPFELAVYESKGVNGLVMWFEVVFAGGDIVVELTTSPFSESTHWSQTVFFLGELIISPDRRIVGMFEMRPNERNPRDQDISISYNSGQATLVRPFKLR